METDNEKLAYKKRLMQQCVQLIELRIAGNLKAIEAAQEAANAEEKSSAGDKYETSRAMSHLEKDMHARQLSANRSELGLLLGIDCTLTNNSTCKGSVVLCDGCSFFIAAGLGKINFEGFEIYLISPGAPLAKLLLQKRLGDKFTFNNKDLKINHIF